MQEIPLDIIREPLCLGKARFFTEDHFRIPTDLYVDKPLSVGEYMKRLCLFDGVSSSKSACLLSVVEYRELEARVQSGLYANAYEQDSVLPQEILEIIFSSITDLDSLLAIRNTCKTNLLFFDTHISEIWSNISRNCIPYRQVEKEALKPVHSLKFFLFCYYRLYYTKKIERFLSLEDALSLHLIQGDLQIALHLMEKYELSDINIARLIAKYIRPEQIGAFCGIYRDNKQLLRTCLTECEKNISPRSVAKWLIFLEYVDRTREELARFLIRVIGYLECGFDKEAHIIHTKLKEKGLFTRAEFRSLIGRYTSNPTVIVNYYAMLCNEDLPIDKELSSEKRLFIPALCLAACAYGLYRWYHR